MSDTITLTFRSTDPSTPDLVTDVPRNLGHVRLIEQVGQGGMGVVWRGRDEMPQRDVAVKLQRQSLLGSNDSAVRQFIEGARAAAGVKHPNIVPVYYADSLQDIVYIVMEFVDGNNLQTILHHKKYFPPDLTALMICKILNSLQAIHAAQVVHRDLKPANVMFNHEGQLMVSDFGLSLQCSSEGDRSEVTSGTPPYMAPEMFRGEASFQSDLYAVGLMHYEMLTGQRPFVAESLSGYRQQHETASIPEEPLNRFKISEEVREVILRATHKQKIFRYKTAGHVLNALEKIYPRLLQNDALERKLREYVLRIEKAHDVHESDASKSTPAATYFDLLSIRADAKRRLKDDE